MKKSYNINADVMMYPSFIIEAENHADAKEKAEKILDDFYGKESEKEMDNPPKFIRVGYIIEHIEVTAI